MIKKTLLITSVILLSSCADTSLKDLGGKIGDLINPSDSVVEVTDLGESEIIVEDENATFSVEELFLLSDEELILVATQQGFETVATFDDNGNLTNRDEVIKALTQPKETQTETAVKALEDSGVSFILYFSYDDTEIDEQATQIIIDHANFMRNNPELMLRLEGHADERGTREYNLALGENRALSVKEVLGLYGLENRIEVVSFGEEHPIAFTHDEASWQKNRRVKFVYQ